MKAIPAEHLELLKNCFYETKVVVTAEEANDSSNQIEKNTRDQSESQHWVNERRKGSQLLTLEALPKSERARSEPKRCNTYNSFKGNAATRYGVTNEDIA